MPGSTRWRDACLPFALDALDYQLCRMGLESEDCYRQVRQWRPAAIAGDAVAAHRVGKAFFASRRYRRAARYLRRAADSGIVSAASDLAKLMLRRNRWAESLAWHRRAADLARAQGLPAVEVAQHYIEAGVYEEAESLLRPEAEQGARAAAMLGTVLDHSYGRDARLDEVEHWYRRAIELGDLSVAESLGNVLETAGRVAEAESYYRLAADQGNRTAARRLGRLAWKAGRDEEAEKYLRIAGGEYGEQTYRYNLDLIEFLANRGRLADAESLISRFSHVTRSDLHHLRAIAAALRRAGCDAAAAKYDDLYWDWIEDHRL